MALFSGNRSIRAIKYGIEPSLVIGEATIIGDEAVVGADHVNVLAAYLGDHLVWDGRISQLIQMPAALAAALAPTGSVSAAAEMQAPLAVGYAEASPSAVSTGALIDVPPAGASASHPLPEWIRGHVWEMPAAEAFADAPASEGIAAQGATLFAEPAVASADAPLSELSVGSSFDIPPADGYASAPPSRAALGYIVEVPTVTAEGSAPAGTWAAPTVLPMGMDKLATQTLSANAWFQITGWTVRADYPNTVIDSNGLVVEGSHDMTVNYRVQFSGAGLASQTKGARVKVNGAVIHTVSAGGDGTANSFRAGSFTASLQDNDVITLEAWHGSSVGTNRNVQEGATNTFLYFDAA